MLAHTEGFGAFTTLSSSRMFLSKCICMGDLAVRLHTEQSVEDSRTGSLESGKSCASFVLFDSQEEHAQSFVQFNKPLIVFLWASHLSLGNKNHRNKSHPRKTGRFTWHSSFHLVGLNQCCLTPTTQELILPIAPLHKCKVTD